MNLIQSIVDRAKANKQRIVLPEGTEERTLVAADRLVADGVADIILIGEPNDIRKEADRLGLKHINGARLLDPKNHEKKQTYADLLLDLRRAKGMTPEKAAELVEDPLYLACLMIKAGDADGEIAGARNTTGNVLRPALQIIKTTKGIVRIGRLPHVCQGSIVRPRGHTDLRRLCRVARPDSCGAGTDRRLVGRYSARYVRQ